MQSDPNELNNKLDLLKKLRNLQLHGITLSRVYDIHSDIKIMEWEYEYQTQHKYLDPICELIESTILLVGGKKNVEWRNRVINNEDFWFTVKRLFDYHGSAVPELELIKLIFNAYPCS